MQREPMEYPFTVMLDLKTRTKLADLSLTIGCTKAQVLRAAINNHHAMTIDGRPHCANGSACHCPHTFIR